MPLTLGTAGHIDHGKTALVAALTGVDTDRLEEEKSRGISIELGYAALGLPSGRRLSLIDVPGHERFVRTMVAGATGIDAFLLVVAADDGVMPQTREHAAVLRALGVSCGVVAITRCDLASPERAADEAGRLMPGAPVVAVSALKRKGLVELVAALDALRVAPRSPEGAAVLHVDRVFTIRGAGTVATGTLWSGSIGAGDVMTVLPRGLRARVRAVQVHDAPVDRAEAGQRVALDLVLGRDEVARGDVLVVGDGPVATYRLDARLDCEPPGRVTVHHGTREALAHPVAQGDGMWSLRLRAPLVAAAGDRVVIRSLAPPDTLGGGVVLDPQPRRAAPVAPGAVPAPAAAASIAPLSAAAEARLLAAGYQPPLDSEFTEEELAGLRSHGRAVRLGPAMHIHVDALSAVRERLAALLAEGPVTLAAFRDALGTSRKYAQALLEHFDSERLTLRVGDERVARRRRGE